MIKLITYNQRGDSLFEFNFKDNIDVDRVKGDIVQLEATKQKYYTSNMSFLAYDTELSFLRISAEWLSLSTQIVEQAYNGKDTILMIFSSADEPIGIFKGNNIRISYPSNMGYTKLSRFFIDNKLVILSNMHFIVIRPKESSTD